MSVDIEAWLTVSLVVADGKSRINVNSATRTNNATTNLRMLLSEAQVEYTVRDMTYKDMLDKSSSFEIFEGIYAHATLEDTKMKVRTSAIAGIP